MTAILYAAVLLLIVGLAGFLLLRADAARIAASLRLAGPLILGVMGLGLILIGRVGAGAMIVSAALAWYGSSRARRQARKSPGARSNVRTAALEMELDHDSGDLSGTVLAGTFEGRSLDELDLPDLLDLARELSSDEESLRLLETYLDGRFPVWREHVEADAGDGQGRASRPGGMTKEEAYEILGLEAGASPADIRKAHRRLMQRLHPDVGGSSFLAARINEAKDVLLSDQR
jgi:hypothetical protein